MRRDYSVEAESLEGANEQSEVAYIYSSRHPSGVEPITQELLGSVLSRFSLFSRVVELGRALVVEVATDAADAAAAAAAAADAAADVAAVDADSDAAAGAAGASASP